MNTKFIYFSISMLILLQTGYVVAAAQPKKEEVLALITQVQSKLDEIKNSPTADLLKTEISKIEEHLSNSKILFEKRKIDLAFYEINIGSLYFMMIEAHIDNHNAQAELERITSKKSQ